MIAFAYDTDGNLTGIAHGKDRPELKRALRELGVTQPGYTALFTSGAPGARVGHLYEVGRNRRQWFNQGRTVELGFYERSILKGAAR